MGQMHFAAVLDRLLSELQIQNPPLAVLLEASLDVNYLQQAAKNLSLDFSDELYIYFGWRNGITDQTANENPVPSLEIFPFGFPLTFENSVMAYKFHAVENDYWKKNYFPVFESNLGDYFLLDIDSNSETQGMILYFSPSNPYWEGAISTADSFSSLVETVLMCYKAKAYYIETNPQGQAFLE